MKKILIISDGTVGTRFIERVINTYSQDNIYYVVQMRAKHFENVDPSKFKFFEFDPTSLSKLGNLLKMEFVQVFIAMEIPTDILNTLKNIRTFKQKLNVVVLDQLGLNIDDSYVSILNANDLLASHLLDHLPNVPVIAQNVGMGEGEIMEVLVPFGSSFVYRHLGVIEQSSWKIAAIYRDRKLIFPNERRMIHPNDILLLVGEPLVLKSVYRAIKRELGQFPAPFGSSLYLYLDMHYDDNDYLVELLNQALYVKEQLKKELIIKVINPGNLEQVSLVKSYRCDDTIVDIEYVEDGSNIILDDIRKYHTGLLLVSKALFKKDSIRRTLYESSVPVLKFGSKELSDIKESIIILNNNSDLEKVSTTIFDFSSQFGFNIELINNINESQKERHEIVEHFENLSTIFTKSIKFNDVDSNQIRALKQRDSFIQCMPFSEKITARNFLPFLSTDSEKLYYRLDEYHQLFIPVRI
ncbi:MAG: potassium transporter TrkA [Campylobacterota bacterium]|nr:potassium transporter TrkA [Campylobacterota bacterium]